MPWAVACEPTITPGRNTCAGSDFRNKGEETGFLVQNGIHVCGDHCASASIESALVSGRRAAESILAG